MFRKEQLSKNNTMQYSLSAKCGWTHKEQALSSIVFTLPNRKMLKAIVHETLWPDKTTAF